MGHTLGFPAKAVMLRQPGPSLWVGVRIMLWLLSATFLLAWLTGLANGYTLDGSIHVLLLYALLALALGFVTRRRKLPI